MRLLYPKILLFTISWFVCFGIYSQVNYDAYIGTWAYQKNDTVFKIRLQKETTYFGSKNLFGGYFLSVKGIVRDNYISATIPAVWNRGTTPPANNIYIKALNVNTPNLLGFTFYDQRKKHLNGEGIAGGKIELLAPNKIHWTLNEWEGLWYILEGEREEGDNRPGIRESMIGFSVPTDVIMMKEQ